tara:strand:- start:31 stop:639 length:609 start_codon:yes stop_codon:yes gene_type:complete
MTITFDASGKVTGNRLQMPAGSGAELSVTEEFLVPCDGTAVTTSKGSVSIENVTAAQDMTTTFAAITGSTISYQPPDNTKIVIYSFTFAGFYSSADPIIMGHIYLDSDAVSDRPFTQRTSQNYVTWSHAFRIEPSLSASTSMGRVTSWSSAKTIKVMAREWSSAYQVKLHNFLNGSAPDTSTNTTNVFAAPIIGIRAIGIRE